MNYKNSTYNIYIYKQMHIQKRIYLYIYKYIHTHKKILIYERILQAKLT